MHAKSVVLHKLCTVCSDIALTGRTQQGPASSLEGRAVEITCSPLIVLNVSLLLTMMGTVILQPSCGTSWHRKKLYAGMSSQERVALHAFRLTIRIRTAAAEFSP